MKSNKKRREKTEKVNIKIEWRNKTNTTNYTELRLISDFRLLCVCVCALVCVFICVNIEVKREMFMSFLKC